MATFEAGLIPHVRQELIHQDPSLTYQASRTRAKQLRTRIGLKRAPSRFLCDH